MLDEGLDVMVQTGFSFLFPCNVGDTVWFVRNPRDPSRRKVEKTFVEKLVVKETGLYLKLGCNAMYETSVSSVGKTVFFSEVDVNRAFGT